MQFEDIIFIHVQVHVFPTLNLIKCFDTFTIAQIMGKEETEKNSKCDHGSFNHV